MLCVATRDAWTDATVTFDDGINPPVVWGASTFADAKSALDDLVATLGGGAWWQASRSSSEAGMDATVYTGVAYTVTANATAQALMGWPATQGPTTSATSGPWAGTIYTAAPSEGQALRRWWRSVDGAGEPGVVPSSPGTAGYRPLLSLALDAVEASRLTAELARSAPTRAASYTDDPGSASPTWRAITLGPVSRSQVGALRWLASLEVRA